MFRKILVYEDALADTHSALQRAIQLSRKNKIALKVIDIVDGPTNTLRELHRPMRSLVEQERKDRLDGLCQPLHKEGIEFKTELIRGRPFIEIVREVVHEGFHLVIKTASGSSPPDAKGIMGAVDLRLIRNCPCPVWLEPSGGETRMERVLVAIDPQAEDDELNEVLLKTGASLADASGAELHVISVWEVPDEDFLSEMMAAEKLTRYASDLKAAAQQSLDSLLVQAGKPTEANKVHFRKGDPAQTILDCVQEYQPDLLILGTVGHTNIRGLLIGDTADAVLRHIGCAVLCIKPDSLFRV